EGINRLACWGDSCVASGDDSGTVKLWDLRQDGSAAGSTATVQVASDYLTDIRPLPTYNRLLAASGDGSMAVVDLATNRSDSKVVCGSQSGLLFLTPSYPFLPLSIVSPSLLLSPAPLRATPRWFDSNVNSHALCSSMLVITLPVSRFPSSSLFPLPFSLSSTIYSDRFRGHGGSVDAIVPLDDDTLLTACSNGLIRLVSVFPNRFLDVVGSHTDAAVEALALSHDNNLLVSAGHDQKIKAWDIAGILDEDEEGEDGEEEKEEEEEEEKQGEKTGAGGGDHTVANGKDPNEPASAAAGADESGVGHGGAEQAADGEGRGKEQKAAGRRRGDCKESDSDSDRRGGRDDDSDSSDDDGGKGAASPVNSAPGAGKSAARPSSRRAGPIYLLVLPIVFFLGIMTGGWTCQRGYWQRVMSLDKDGDRDGNRDRDIRDLEAISVNSTIGSNSGVDSKIDSVVQATNQITDYSARNDGQADSGVESSPSIKANVSDQLDADFLLRYKAGRVGLTEASIQTSKLAFLFMTRGRLPLAPFWERFFKGHEGFFSIYIHTAREFRYKPGELPSAFEGAHIPSQDVHWGEISMVDAERRLLANALLDPGNARFILVSESCTPLFNFTFVYEYLMASPEAYVRLKNEPGTNGRGRWRREFLPLVRLEDWRKGGQWFAMDREAARVIVTDDIFYPLFKRFCRPPCYADEHYMPTMLKVLMPGNVANRTVTWTDWSKPGAAHPAQFSAGQVTEKLIERMRGPPGCRVADESVPCFLFARKLMPGALTDLLRLADYIGM
ncbi:unnamed protein product, partial [Closterium sp. NIES-54]